MGDLVLRGSGFGPRTSGCMRSPKNLLILPEERAERASKERRFCSGPKMRVMNSRGSVADRTVRKAGTGSTSARPATGR